MVMVPVSVMASHTLAKVWLSMASPLEFMEPFGGKIDIPLGGLLGLLLEGVQHDNPVRQGGEIDHPERARALPDADFPDTRAHRRHRLPVVRLQPALHPVQLVAGGLAGIVGEVADAGEAVADELDGLHGKHYIRIDIDHKHP